MPLQSDSQIIGYQGELWFRSQLPRGWIPQPPERDVGIDFIVVVSEEGDLDKREFRVQVKATKSPKMLRDAISVRNIKRSTIDYWFLSPLPTLIVVYDTTSDRGFFVWHSAIYHDVYERLSSKSDKISINVPLANELNHQGWDTIRRDLGCHYKTLSEALYALRNSQSLIPTIHDLAAAARQLNSIDHQRIAAQDMDSKQEGLLALMEMMQHRLIVNSLSRLHADLAPNSDGARRLNEWTTAYEKRVSSIFPNFSALNNWDHVPPDFKITFAKNLIHEHRYTFIEAILEMIMLLAPGQFNRDYG